MGKVYIDEDGIEYSRLSSSRTPRDSLKYIEIPVVRHIRFPELRKKINLTIKCPKFICNLTPLHKIYILKLFWKREKLLLKSNFSSYPQYFYLLLSFYVRTGTRISLRDKRLFEITEVEITRVDCTCSYIMVYPCALEIRRTNNNSVFDFALSCPASAQQGRAA